MSYWERDPYLPETRVGENRPPTEGGRSELAQKAFEALKAIAYNEGLDVLGFKEMEPCINTGATTYQYCPQRPEIVVLISQPWPQARWSLAVALGHHFTRHHFYQMSDRALWRQQAEQWALSFLAAHTVQHSRYPEHLPDNSPRVPVPPRQEEKPPKATRRLDRRRVTCKAVRRDGKPCRGYPTPGTPFCRHHQDQNLLTLADIVGGLRGGSHE